MFIATANIKLPLKMLRGATPDAIPKSNHVLFTNEQDQLTLWYRKRAIAKDTNDAFKAR
jgi:hypothetical protein